MMEPLVIDNRALESGSDPYFDVVLAKTHDLLNRVYELRYQVYCVEHAYEDPFRFPTGRETDRYDAYSKHVALVHRATGEVVGTGRLVLPESPFEPQLPLFSVVEQDARAELEKFPLVRTAEISRYSISKCFRRRKGEDEFPDVEWHPLGVENGRRLMPHLTLHLIRGLLQVGVSSNVDYFCACMRPALLRLLRHLGLNFTNLGPLVEHHGLRQPCVASVRDLIRGLKEATTISDSRGSL